MLVRHLSTTLSQAANTRRVSSQTGVGFLNMQEQLEDILVAEERPEGMYASVDGFRRNRILVGEPEIGASYNDCINTSRCGYFRNKGTRQQQ